MKAREMRKRHMSYHLGQHEARQSKYPIERKDEGNMSHRALAFNTALYYTKLSTTVEEALAIDHWRRAMEEEISALKKNGT